MMHLAQDRLLALMGGRMTEVEASDAFGHVAECVECARRLRVLRAIARDPAAGVEAFEQYLAGLAGATRVVAASAGTGVPAESGPIRCGIAVRVLLDGARRLAAAGLEVVRDLTLDPASCRLVPVPVYRGVGSTDASEAAARLGLAASELLSAGRTEDARSRLLEAKKAAPDLVEVAEVEATTGDAPPVRVIVDAARHSITVLAQPRGGVASASVRRPARALLMDESGTVVRSCDLSAVSGADYLLAEFEDVGDATWLVGIDW